MLPVGPMFDASAPERPKKRQDLLCNMRHTAYEGSLAFFGVLVVMLYIGHSK